MRTIQSIFMSILILGAVDVSAQQCGDPGVEYYSGQILTFANNPVTVGFLCPGIPDYDPSEITNLRNAFENDNKYKGKITFISNPSKKYWCHTYAWANKEDFRLDSPLSTGSSAATYLTDYSYVKVTTPVQGGVVAYGVYHSAQIKNVNTNPVTVRSKWGDGAVYEHPINLCPWDIYSLTYYATKPDFTKSSSIICINTTFTITTNLSSDHSYVWSKCSSNLTQDPNNPGKFTATGSGSASVTIKIDNKKEIDHTFIIYDKPTIPNGVVGSDYVTTYSSTYYYVSVSSALTPFSINWSLGGGSYNLSPTTGSYTYATFYETTSYYLNAAASNSCGTTYAFKYIQVPYSPSPAYPNPVSDILSVEIEQHTIDRAKALQKSASDAKSTSADPTFDIRLYDGLGNLLRQTSTNGGTVQFNVSNLPAGNYYLHIYDGVSDKPEMQQILVEH